MSLFVEDDDLIQIDVNYYKQGKNIIILDPFKEIPKGIEIQKETFSIKLPNWMDAVAIASASSIVDGQTGQVLVNPHKFNDTRLKLLLKDWTLKDKDGSKLKITNELIDKLSPVIVEYIGMELVRQTTIKNEVVPENTEELIDKNKNNIMDPTLKMDGSNPPCNS